MKSVQKNWIGFLIILMVVCAGWVHALDLEEEKEEKALKKEAKKAALTHRYEERQQVAVFVNKIGPYQNPSESYDYYSLPFCPPPKIHHRHTSLGEDIEGDHYTNSPYDIRFGVDMQWNSLCKIHMNEKEIKQLRDAIKNYYHFEMTMDDLPLSGFVGTIDRSMVDESGNPVERYFLFKHLHFSMLYNEDRVIYANVTADLRQVQELVPDEEGLTVEFSYSVSWTPSIVSFEDRMDLYKEGYYPLELEIHWLSIMNSFVLVILLTGFIAIIILRVLKSDYTRYSRVEDGDDEQDDYGWKLVHGDVFRFPAQANILAALLGNGAQFVVVVAATLILALTGVVSPSNPGALPTTAIVLYSITCIVSGGVSAGFYKQMEGEKWAWNVITAATIFAVPFFVVTGVLNAVSSYNGINNAIAFSSAAMLIAIWLFVGFPLTLLGAIIGKRITPPFDASTRTTYFPRLIPPIPWYRQAPMQLLMAGFLPFSAIYIELYYIYNSVWGHHHYTLYGILFLVFLILLTVTACITIALTYFQLSLEDHRWWWRSFLSGGSTGFFIYVYSLFYYLYRSPMSGWLQSTFFFGHMLVICFFFWIMLGTVGFYSSLIFVRQIYRNLKCD